MAVGDFNGDSIPDIAAQPLTVTEASVLIGQVSVLIGDGLGGFPTRQTITGLQGRAIVGFADFTGDGRADLALRVSVGAAGESRIYIFTWSPTGPVRLEPPLPAQNAGSLGAVSDFNRDGVLDLAVAEIQPRIITAFLGNGNGTFRPGPLPLLAFPDADHLAAVDFNQDRIPDLFTINFGRPTGQYSTFLGYGDGTFRQSHTLPSPCRRTASWVFRDFNNDNRMDLVVGCHSFLGGAQVLLGGGNGSFQPGFPLSNENLEIITMADLNGDGVDELLARGDGGPDSSPAFRVLVRQQNRFVASMRPIMVTNSYEQPIVADLNRDGLPDVVLPLDGYTPRPSGGVAILLNRPSPTQSSLNLISPVSATAAGPVSLPAGQTLRFQARINRSANAFDFLQGNVSLRSGDQRMGSAALDSSGLSVITTERLPAGRHSFTAVYEGNMGNLPSNSQVLVVTATPIPVNITAETPASSAYGQPVTVSVSLNPPIAGAVLNVMADGSAVGSLTVSEQGRASTALPPLAPGTRRITVAFAGDAFHAAATSAPALLQIAKARTTCALTSSPNPAPLFSAVTLAASIRVEPLGAGAPTGNIAIFDGEQLLRTDPFAFSREMVVTTLPPGTRMLQARYAGDDRFEPCASSPIAQTITDGVLVISTASGARQVAPNSLATAYGIGLATEADPSAVRVEIRDANGAIWPATVLFASPSQINFLLPGEASAGTAEVSVVTADDRHVSGAAEIRGVAPGIFTANGDGKGVAAALLVTASPDGTQSLKPVFDCDPRRMPSCIPTPIEIDEQANPVLVVFGTGFRNRSAISSVRVRITDREVAPSYAGPQPDYPGLDQINIPLSPDLRGLGPAVLHIQVDGQPANPVEVQFR